MIENQTQTKSDKLMVSKAGLPSLVPIIHSEQLAFFERLAKNSNTSVKNATDAMLIYESARALNINWATAMQRMHIIEGKITLDINLIKAVLSRPSSGVTWKRTKSNEPYYMYINNKDKSKIKQEYLPKGYIEVPLYEFVDRKNEDAFIVTKQINTETGDPVIYDWTTSYIFTRKKKDITGEWYEYIEDELGTFSWLKAVHAKLPKGEKSAWLKYTWLMIDHRAFKFGAYAIAADLLAGCDEITEILDINNITYDLKNDEVTILDINNSTYDLKDDKVTILDKDGKKLKPKEDSSSKS